MGLAGQRIMAEGGQAGEATATMGTGELTDRHRQAIDQRQHRVAAGGRSQMLPERVFDHPQVGGLAAKGGPMHHPQAREEIAEVAAEVAKEVLISGDAEKLSDRFDGQDLTVGQRWLWAALAQLVAA